MTPTVHRLVIATLVFGAVLAAHYWWVAAAGPHTQWVSLDDSPPSATRVYLESGAIWLGLSYALALAFAAVSLERYRQERFCTARTLSIGGVTLSGFLGVAGCYALGCCGSPMLAVYMSLFGTAFLPFTKPLVFLVTATSLAAAWWWAERKRHADASVSDLTGANCSGGSC